MSLRFTITENHETPEHKRSNHSARTKWRKQNPAEHRYADVPTRFVCIDGEGVTRPDGTHVYVLLGVGDKHIENPDGLSFEECIEFMWSQFCLRGTKSVAYTGFFLAYDFVQWLKGLPEERARMLLSAEGRAKRQPKSDKRRMPFPVRYGEWEFDILGTKRFKVRKSGSDRWMSVCDAGPFFQTSFLNVIDPEKWDDPVVSQEEYETIAHGKANRSGAVLDSDMRKYNALENDALSRVLCKLNEGFQSLGIHLRPNQWFGPGQAAQAWLERRAITCDQLRSVTPMPVLEAAIGSYYGGWFEIMAHGLVSGTTWEYDINSAYPYVISSLPCLKHGEWIHNGTTGDTAYTLVYARVHGSNPYVGSMLHRDGSGNISRPHDTESWYWLHEVEAAQRAGIVDSYRITETWSYQACDCPSPFAEVQDIYTLRQKVGKKTPLGIACKLVPNSLYGKFAQSIGSPKFANPIYASLTTAGTREMLLDAISTHPKGAASVLMVATDGIYFTEPHPSLPCSNVLGEWESARKENLCLFKPGVYWDDHARERIQEGKTPVFKARGVNARDFAQSLADIDDQFRALSDVKPERIAWPEVTFPLIFSMVTAVQALQRGKWESAGSLVKEPTARQSSNPVLKRSSWYWDNDILRSRPVVNDPYTASVAYEKRFGIQDPFGQEIQEENGITPDGYPGNLWKEALYDLQIHLRSMRRGTCMAGIRTPG